LEAGAFFFQGKKVRLESKNAAFYPHFMKCNSGWNAKPSDHWVSLLRLPPDNKSDLSAE
jgi:hypothetical protein